MVAVEVGDEDSVQALVPHFVLHQAALGAFATVNQIRLVAHREHLRRVMPIEKGCGRGTPQDFQLKLQNKLVASSGWLFALLKMRKRKIPSGEL